MMMKRSVFYVYFLLWLASGCAMFKRSELPASQLRGDPIAVKTHYRFKSRAFAFDIYKGKHSNFFKEDKDHWPHLMVNGIDTTIDRKFSLINKQSKERWQGVCAYSYTPTTTGNPGDLREDSAYLCRIFSNADREPVGELVLKKDDQSATSDLVGSIQLKNGTRVGFRSLHKVKNAKFSTAAPFGFEILIDNKPVGTIQSVATRSPKLFMPPNISPAIRQAIALATGPLLCYEPAGNSSTQPTDVATP